MTGARGPWNVGLTVVREDQRLGPEPFYQEMIAGLEGVLGPRDATLLLQIVTSRKDEEATCARWAGRGAVDAVLLVDLETDDARVELVRRLGLPAVVVGDPSTAAGLPAVWTDDAAAMRHAVGVLAGLGHTVIGRVSGPSPLAHSRIRTEAFREAVREGGLRAAETEAEYSEEAGRLATLRLLSAPDRPTAVIYDDDLMALGGLSAAAGKGLAVPGDLSLLAWDDSALCQLSSPSLSVMGHDVRAIGEQAAAAVLDLVEGRARPLYRAPTATFLRRESVSAPGAAGLPQPAA
ncbi:substrate-binding domain-containing protein [Streptomyces sp. NPDC049954]|uniref:LacI family DNA-binding transcriptional regulator n=1 Tax=Streptomyces sp. NPDC049954 TaxID=3155779 RepID=UPI003430D3B3